MPRPIFPAKTYVEGIRSGDRVLLSQAITLVESTRAEHRQLADEIIAELLAGQNFSEKKLEKKTLRIAITGAPGVGKSTFIEAFGSLILDAGHRVAVLAIDPSSQISGGSILGDKTRMDRLAADPRAFIRPTPSGGGTLGGVARRTRETILLAEAAGFDLVFVETVGVGQSETTVRGMTDLFLLLLLPGAGDDLQGIKRGIVEMADLLVVNKSDGERVKLARLAQSHYQNATHLLPPAENGWSPKVLICSALEKNGLDEIWQQVKIFQKKMDESGWLVENRRRQSKQWMLDSIRAGLSDAFFADAATKVFFKKIETEVLAGRVSPFVAARLALDTFFKNVKF